MSQKSQKKWKSRVVVLFLLAYLISPVPLSQANTAQTLTICISLKTGVQTISKSGNCNERLYEKVTWFQNGNSPQGTPGSKLISMTTCRSKSVGNTQVIKKSCNRTIQTTLKWQRPLGPPEAPSIVSITPGNLGTAEIMVMAPENNGGARITSYSVVQFNNDVTSSKSSVGSKFLGTSAVSYPLKSREKISVGGLTPGQSYRFAVVASNVAGTSQLSESSKEYSVPTIPNSPTITSVIASGPGSALITFVVSETEFTAPINSFTITANPGGLQSTVTSPLLRSHTFNGLSPLTSYTFTMTANSEAGTSSPSEQSLSVRTFAPQPPPEPVQTASVPSSPASSAPPAPIAAPVIALSSNSETITAGVALTGYTIASTGGAVASYSISPSAPAGLTFDATIGLLSGTPTVAASSTIYTVTGTNATGSAAATFTLTVMDPIAISVPAIAGVTAPVKDATPVSTTTAGTGYTGVVSWSGSPTTFGAATTYTATITLTAASGYTLTGVSANFFSVEGATTVTHSADSGVITAVFPATESRVYTIGETGPGGGTIFYVASTPFACGPARAAICKYLEAAPANWSGGSDPTRAWANTTYQSIAVNNGSSPQKADQTEIGWGYSNTRAIILQGNTDPNTSAAALADAYTATVSSVVYDDWYLPSKYELNEMCKWARGVTGTSITTLCTGGSANAGVMFNGETINPGFQSAKAYWSSTEGSANTAGYIYFPHASQATSNKGGGNTEHVRPIRAFY